jgi:small conductance mechanosensitive channel
MINAIEQYFEKDIWLEQAVPFLQNLLLALVIYLIGIWVAKRLVGFIDKMMGLRGFDEALRGFLAAVLSVLFTLIVVLIAAEQLGLNTTSLLALLGAAGLAVALALKDSLSNFAAGVMLITFKPFKVGAYVEAGGTAGIIEKITIFNTILRSPDNKVITVPNSQIYSSPITNHSARATRRIDMVFGIGYDDDIRKARNLIQQTLNADERVHKEPEPVIAVNELAESSVNLVVRPWCTTDDYWPLRWDLIENIKRSFDENGITIPFPQRDVWVKSDKL